MRRPLVYRYAVLLLGLLTLGLSGCASSTPSKFYTLTSMESTGPAGDTHSATHVSVVALGPLSIPDYLDKPQIVTRSGRNELAVDEFHRWGGSLENDVLRVLFENLSALLPADQYHVVNWIHPAQPFAPGDYRVSVDLVRFDGILGDSVSLKATWSVFRKDRDVTVRRSSITEPIRGGDYKSLVEAMSRAMEGLSRDIAGTITSFKD